MINISSLNKKAASILIFGLISFFVMTVLTVVTWQTVEKIDFDKYAGEDAQYITSQKYAADKQLFFIKDVLKEYIENEVSLDSYHEYLQSNALLPLSMDGLILEDEDLQYYFIYEKYLNRYLSESFSTYYAEKAKLFNDNLRGDLYLESNNDFLLTNNQEYSLYITESTIRAFATFPQKNEYSSGNAFVYYPHVTLDDAATDTLLLDFLLPINTKIQYSACLIDSTPSDSVYQDCADAILVTHNDLLSSTRGREITADLVALQITTKEDNSFFYVFNKP